MPAIQNKNGKAFVYIVAEIMKDRLERNGANVQMKHCSILDEGLAIVENGEGGELIARMRIAANHAISPIIENEPHSLSGNLTIMAQDNAKDGDPRDIIIEKTDDHGSPVHETGIVARWNAATAKSFRINQEGFANEWFRHPESQQWKDATNGIWQLLGEKTGDSWETLENKDEVYNTLRDALCDEFISQSSRYEDSLFNFVQKSIGRSDYWEIFAKPASKSVVVRGNGLHGYLGMTENGKMNFETGKYPTKIIEAKRKDGVSGTLLISMDNGWSFDLRIHNGDAIIRRSLKTDIRFTGIPALVFEKSWNTSYSGKRNQNARNGNQP